MPVSSTIITQKRQTNQRPSRNVTNMRKSKQQPTSQDASASTSIRQPTDDDILCGKSRDCLSHVGSRRYRVYISKYVDRYSQAETKYEKMTITKEIYSNLSPTCRFLRFNKSEGQWEEVSQSTSGRFRLPHALHCIAFHKLAKLICRLLYCFIIWSQQISPADARDKVS